MSSDSRPSIVSAISFKRLRFQGIELRSTPLPLCSSACRDSVPSPTGLTGLPLRAFWLSYSRCVIFERNPKGVTPSVPPLTRSEAPHARLVEQTLRDFHPMRSLERSHTQLSIEWSEPPVWDYPGFAGITHLNHHGQLPCFRAGKRPEASPCLPARQRSFSVAPIRLGCGKAPIG